MQPCLQTPAGSPPSPPGGAESERYHGLDTLRAAAMLLGVAIHAAVPFVASAPEEFQIGTQRAWTFDFLAWAIHGFRMPLFFVVAGFFAALLLTRQGTAGFVRQRARRILFPFLVALALYNVPLALVDAQARQMVPVPLHLWFLQYLLIYYLLSLALVACVPHSWTQRACKVFGAVLPRRGSWILFSLPTTVCLFYSPLWADASGDMGLSMAPSPSGLPFYGLFYGFGWLLYRRRELLPLLESHIRLRLAIAGLLLLIIWPSGYYLLRGTDYFHPNVSAPHYVWVRAGSLVAFGLYGWVMIFAWFGLFLKYFSRPIRIVRYLSDASYWIYLTHIPVTLFFTGLILPVPVSPLLKFPLIVAATLLVLIYAYDRVVRYTWLGTALNGPRIRTPLELPPAPAGAPAPGRTA
jgi:glucans biosynthesis protein C